MFLEKECHGMCYALYSHILAFLGYDSLTAGQFGTYGQR